MIIGVTSLNCTHSHRSKTKLWVNIPPLSIKLIHLHMVHKHIHMCSLAGLLSSGFFSLFFFYTFKNRERVVWSSSAAASLLVSLQDVFSQARSVTRQAAAKKKKRESDTALWVQSWTRTLLLLPVCVPVVRSNYHSPGFRVYDFGDVAFRLFITLRTVIVKENNELLTFLPCQVCRQLYLYSIHDRGSVELKTVSFP